jgi:hypothetical protein
MVHMSVLIQPLFVLVLFIAVRAGDLSITAAIARNTIRATLYGIVALLALIVVVLDLLGIH